LVQPGSLYTEFGFYTLVEELKERARERFDLGHELRPIAFIVHERDIKTGKDLLEPQVSIVEPHQMKELDEGVEFSDFVKLMAAGSQAIGVIALTQSWILWNGGQLDVPNILKWMEKGKALKDHPLTKESVVIMIDHRHFGKRMMVAEVKRKRKDYPKLSAWKDLTSDLEKTHPQMISRFVDFV